MSITNPKGGAQRIDVREMLRDVKACCERSAHSRGAHGLTMGRLAQLPLTVSALPNKLVCTHALK